MQLVVVESPAKAKTINKYLGPEYVVLASYGHIRDLPSKDGSVLPDEGFSMSWELSARAGGVVKDLVKHAKKADKIILATDPDREGEAISWHLHQVFEEQGLISAKRPAVRAVFNEITKTAITQAMQHPRAIDQALVDAYLARRALDYLVGFNLSPVLWRKLPGSRSAGRVQSVALRLICERETEIERFLTQEYWSVEALLQSGAAKRFTSHVVGYQGAKVEKMTLATGEQAHAIVAHLQQQGQVVVHQLEKKAVQRQPYPPFITSTLQQEAAKQLGFAVSRTMQTAQRLYEGVEMGTETVGLITYMRTDGVTLAGEAIAGIRAHIGQAFGPQYLPSSPRLYKSKNKNAQEGHEAIRPTDVRRTPQQVQRYLSEDQFRLYDLIWRRTMACQMANAQLDQTRVELLTPDGQVTLRSSGSVITFDGFYKVFRQGREEQEAVAEGDEDEQALPPLTQGQVLPVAQVNANQHFTKPPPRFSEASLVKQLEELSIGRPSTYASIIKVLQERQYVAMEARRFIPQERGRLVTAFLVHFFRQYVEYDFTAALEAQLDDITSHSVGFKQVLTQFWQPFKTTVENTKNLTMTEVLDTLEQDLEAYFFPKVEGQSAEEQRHCPLCHDGQKGGRLGLKLGKFGAFIGCSEYPTCKFTRQIHTEGATGQEDGADAGLEGGQPKALGQCPTTHKAVVLAKGPYGFYVQLGEAEEVPPPPGSRAKKPKLVKPKRSSLPAGLAPAAVDLEKALALLSLPRLVGYTAEATPIYANNGRFGPYLQIGSTFVSLKPPDDVFTVEPERARDLLEASGKKAVPLGEHLNAVVELTKSRFGLVLNYRKQKIYLPKTLGKETEGITLEQVLPYLEAKLAAPKEGKAAAKTGAKTSAASSPAKKATARKAAPKRTAAKKAAAPKRTVRGKVSKTGGKVAAI